MRGWGIVRRAGRTDDPVRPGGVEPERGADGRSSSTTAGELPRLVPYVAAIFASAFLIFLVQPMVGKRILPWFGGVPAVWAVCLAFHQTLLFVGYAYAHGLIRFLDTRRQLAVHALLAVAAIVSLPVLPEQPPSGLDARDPSIEVLLLLATSVALPFLCLSATGPLVQAWFARAFPERSPYPLYAVSNLGSLLALAAYPFAIEPRLPLSATGSLWGTGFAATALATLACAVPLIRSAGPAIAADAAPGDPADARPGAIRPLLWVALSGTAVVILMGVTNQLCLDVASFPFLWMLPLAIYLLTFILAFASDRTYHRPVFVVLALAAFAASETVDFQTPFLRQTATYGALLFTTCMILHGELHRARPAPRSLTFFYLCVSAGGALGGLFVGLAAPELFDDYHELPIGLGLTGVLVLAIVLLERRERTGGLAPLESAGAIAAAVALIGAIGLRSGTSAGTPPLLEERSFFGVLRVESITNGTHRQNALTHGTTMHGRQFVHPVGRRIPTAYYGAATGLGLAITSGDPEVRLRIGVIGLGIGTIAAYGRPGDLVRFYEIDPVVVRIARDSGYFHYLVDSEADVEIVVEDARRSLVEEQRRAAPQAFDFLVLDAFSSDAIPVHLLTREAVASDLAALAPDGVLAVHLSSRSFDLVGVVARIAAELGAQTLQIRTTTVPELNSLGSEWVFVTRSAAAMTRLEARIDARRRELGVAPEACRMRRFGEREAREGPLWTDDYSDVLRVLRPKR
ncbi:MAG: fused MFS/spermidine synthase [Myxococcota bacterium]